MTGPHAGIAEAGGTAESERRKAWATWQARAALRGHQLRRLDDGRWLASCNAWSRELVEAEVEGWLRLIGAPA